MSINTFTGRPARRSAPAQPVRAVLAALNRRLHATADTCARDIGWTVTVMPGPLGPNGRSYRDPRFGARPGAGERHA
jgi:hypothetical protein